MNNLISFSIIGVILFAFITYYYFDIRNKKQLKKLQEEYDGNKDLSRPGEPTGISTITDSNNGSVDISEYGKDNTTTDVYEQPNSRTAIQPIKKRRIPAGRKEVETTTEQSIEEVKEEGML